MLASRCLPPGFGRGLHARAAARLGACALGASTVAAVAFPAAAATGRGEGASSLPPSRKGGRALKKGELPTLPCQQCGLPMNYRAKWRDLWPNVKFCSDRCKKAAKQKGAAGGGGEGEAA
jgi:hypothetical protein